MGGIRLQQLFVFFFMCLTARFHYLLQQSLAVPIEKPVSRLFYVLYTVLILITVRSIYRLIEFANGVHSSVATHEAYFYCFESLPILAALTSFNIVHPSTVLVGPNSEFPAKDPETNSKEKNATDKTTRQQQNDQVDSPV
jgi:hypothetical protein